jgi:hypothetical protein
VAVAPGGRHLREVGEPRLLTTDHASPQLFLPSLEGVGWQPMLSH